jgi:ankyrin repeat protein
MKKEMFVVISLFCNLNMVCMDKKKSADKENLRKLFVAIDWNNLREVRDIIKTSPQLVNMRMQVRYSFWDDDKLTPIHRCSNPVVLETLLRVPGADVSVVTKHNGNTGLHLTSQKKIAKQLIKAGVSVNQKNRWGKSPLHKVLFNDNFDALAHMQKYARYLVKKGANVDECIDDRGNVLLHEATQGNYIAVVSFLLQHRANPEICNYFGETPIDHAMKNANLEIMSFFEQHHTLMFPLSLRLKPEDDPFKLLCNDGALFKQLVNSNVPAVCRARHTVARLLMSAQKTMSRYDDHYRKAKGIVFTDEGYYSNRVSIRVLNQMFSKGRIIYVYTHLKSRYQQIVDLIKISNRDAELVLAAAVKTEPLFLVYDANMIFDLLLHCMENDFPLFERLLEYKPNLLGQDINGNGLLHNTVLQKNFPAIQLLLYAGIPVEMKNNDGKTAFRLADEVGQDCVDFFHTMIRNNFCSLNNDSVVYKNFKKIMSHSSFDMNIVDAKGRTMLFDAIKKSPEKCSSLVKRGANLAHKDNKGRIPLVYALKNCEFDTVLDLLDDDLPLKPYPVQFEEPYWRDLPNWLHIKLHNACRLQHLTCASCKKAGGSRVAISCKKNHMKILCRNCEGMRSHGICFREQSSLCFCGLPNHTTIYALGDWILDELDRQYWDQQNKSEEC